MRSFFILAAILPIAPHFFYAQAKIDTTHTVVVTGVIRREISLDVAGLNRYPVVEAGDIPILNHLGVVKKTLTRVKGVRVREALQGLEFPTENPKDLSEFYFVFTATDGYRVVFSWNEIFNSKAGEGIFFILERDGKTAAELDDSIAVISTSDVNTGRRYVKGLKTISVRRAD